MDRRNHHRVIEGAKVSNPFSKNRLRVERRWYTLLAIKNIPEEQNPCPTIMITAPFIPQEDRVKIPLITKAMWATEDKAINIFTSVWRKQKVARIAPPTMAHLTHNQL